MKKACRFIWSYRNLIVLITSIVLLFLGLLGIMSNIADILKNGPVLNDVLEIVLALVVIVCFLLYYGLYIITKKSYPALVSISFTLYSLFVVSITLNTFIVSHFIMAISIGLLTLSFTDHMKSIVSIAVSVSAWTIVVFAKISHIIPYELLLEESNMNSIAITAILALLIIFLTFVAIYVDLLVKHNKVKQKMNLNRLTAMEQKIGVLMIKGYNRYEIRDKLKINTLKSVETHIYNIKNKLDVPTVEAIPKALAG